MNLTIWQLTINQTGCFDTGLELLWPDLESQVSPARLVLVGAKVFFVQPPKPATSWTPSISSALFSNCTFEVLPSHAFRGMSLLTEVTFDGGYIGIMKSNAFSNLPQLKRVDISNATLGVMESRSFTSLPRLQDLHIVHSSVREVETEAVSLVRQSGETSRCDDIGLTSSLPTGDDTNELAGRELMTSVSNLSLPEYGSRIFLFKNSIEVVNPRAFSTNTFGFLIAGGNYIGHLGHEAFTMELHNECEIAAALFIGNIFGKLDSNALLGLKGQDGMSYQTFLALSNNSFLSVSPGAFILHPSLVIFTVQDNRFECSCNKLDWMMLGGVGGNEESSTEQQQKRDLVKELVQEGYCLDGHRSLVSFASSCGNGTNINTTHLPSHTTTYSPSHTNTTHPPSHITTITPPRDSGAQGTSVSVAGCVLTLLMGWTLSSTH